MGFSLVNHPTIGVPPFWKPASIKSILKKCVACGYVWHGDESDETLARIWTELRMDVTTLQETGHFLPGFIESDSLEHISLVNIPARSSEATSYRFDLVHTAALQANVKMINSE